MGWGEVDVLEWLFPRTCAVCGRGGVVLCPGCGPGGWCRPASRSEGIEATFALSRYETPLGEALRRVKVTGDRGRAGRLAGLFAARIGEVMPPGSVHAVVPAPSTLRARWARGFSFASVLAHGVAARLGVPCQEVLWSTADSRLAKLGARERRLALRGRIRCDALVPGAVLLVDDVLTSGATAEACAMELLGGATERVLLATLCAVADHPGSARVGGLPTRPRFPPGAAGTSHPAP